jgi:hypothetical protein
VWIFGTKGGRVPVEFASMNTNEQSDFRRYVEVKWRPEMVNHFTTCPNRDEFKRFKKAGTKP